MALPGNVVSSPALQTVFLAPDSSDSARLESLEQGGIALNDGSQGRQVQTWRAWVNLAGTEIRTSPLSGTPETRLLTRTDITAVSLAFDSNMQPTITYTEAGVVKLRWFDAVSGDFVITTLTGATMSKVATDDKRESQEGASDVIVAYIRADVLYWRMQRDRYLVEYTAGALPAGYRLVTIGMNAINRFQFKAVFP